MIEGNDFLTELITSKTLHILRKYFLLRKKTGIESKEI